MPALFFASVTWSAEPSGYVVFTMLRLLLARSTEPLKGSSEMPALVVESYLSFSTVATFEMPVPSCWGSCPVARKVL